MTPAQRPAEGTFEILRIHVQNLNNDIFLARSKSCRRRVTRVKTKNSSHVRVKRFFSFHERDTRYFYAARHEIQFSIHPLLLAAFYASAALRGPINRAEEQWLLNRRVARVLLWE